MLRYSQKEPTCLTNDGIVERTYIFNYRNATSTTEMVKSFITASSKMCSATKRIPFTVILHSDVIVVLY